jgi:hypothetical protein
MTEKQAEETIRELKGIRILLRFILILGVVISASHTLWSLYPHK